MRSWFAGEIGVGTHGADIVTVHAKTGRVALWDTKWRTNPTLIGPSKTFTGTNTLNNALDQARIAIEEATHIPQSLKDTALQKLRQQDYVTRTPGIGPGARSSGL